MSRMYFNGKAAIWDEIVAERDITKLQRMSQRLNIEPGSRLLDVGTGTGVFTPFLLSKVGRNGRIIALDFAAKMLERAGAKSFDGNIDYLCADVTNIPLVDEIFDVVVCYSSFPHFQDKLTALTEINRVTKGGGKLLICHTSSRTEINEIHHEIPAVQNDLIPDKSEMQEILSTAGFIDIKIESNSESYLASAKKPKQERLREFVKSVAQAQGSCPRLSRSE